MLIDVRGPGTTLGSCFYPKNTSLPEEEVVNMFTNASMNLPDVLFHPLHYARHLGLTDDSYYKEGFFQLPHKNGSSMIKTYGLGKEFWRLYFIKFYYIRI